MVWHISQNRGFYFCSGVGFEIGVAKPGLEKPIFKQEKAKRSEVKRIKQNQISVRDLRILINMRPSKKQQTRKETRNTYPTNQDKCTMWSQQQFWGSIIISHEDNIVAIPTIIFERCFGAGSVFNCEFFELSTFDHQYEFVQIQYNAFQKQSCYNLIITLRMKNYLRKANPQKERRKPVDDNFAPKRLAINFDPPMIIMEYLVVDTGKLYHHKMRLDSILKKPEVTRTDVLLYIKNKHHLYFSSGKVTDELIYKFIDKILIKFGKASNKEQKFKENKKLSQNQKQVQTKKDDFYFLNDDIDGEEFYEEDYEDYSEGEQEANPKNVKNKEKNDEIIRNAYLQYCRNYDKDEGEGQAEWDLDMDEDVDFV